MRGCVLGRGGIGEGKGQGADQMESECEMSESRLVGGIDGSARGKMGANE